MSRTLDSRVCRAALAIAALLLVSCCFALGLLVAQGSKGFSMVGAELSREETQSRTGDVHRLMSDVAALAKTPSLLTAFESLEKGYSAYIPAHLRDMYVTLNPHQGEDLSLLSDTRDGSLYGRAHAEHHAWLREVSRAQGFADLFLVRADGHVIYSVRKGRTFATRVGEGDGERSVREFARVAREAGVKGAGRVEVSSEVSSLLGGREVYAATALFSSGGRHLGTLVAQRAAGEPIVSSGLSSLTEAKEKWETGALVVISGFALVAAFLLGGLILVARTSPRPQESGLALIPVEQSQADVDSGRTGSHRSGTRPVLSPSGAPKEDLGTRASGDR